ncbi:MAG TPA: chromate resistance protein ChrB domain-containing protein, partial [Vicinamibacterales bacterium]
MRASDPRAQRRAATQAVAPSHRWLLFVHQLPANPSNLRVRTWRRLQQIGAVAVKQAVYVLPDSPDAREDFEWLKTEIEGAGGQASVFSADTVDTWSHDALVEEFRRLRQDAYTALAREAEQVLRRSGAGSRRSQRMPSRRVVQQLRERLTAIEHVDFFGSAGRDRVIALVRQIEDRASGTLRGGATPKAGDARSYHAQLWVTRPRPGVDRMASAWLIRRFIDPDARFAFVADRNAVPAGAIPFDMFGVEFSHQGDGCTFETLCTVFGIHDAAVARLAGIVHDLDLKDGRFGAPEAATVGSVIQGLQLAHADDDALLVQGMALFDSLFRAFEQSAH